MATPKKPVQPEQPAPEYMLSRFEDRVLLSLVIAVSIAMFWISWPFFGAILWAVIAAIMFAPVNDWITMRMPKYRNLAAVLTLFLVIGIVIVPAFTIASLMVDQAIETYAQLQSRKIDFAQIFRDIQNGIPNGVMDVLKRFGFGDFNAIQQKFSSFITGGLQLVAAQAVNIGQGAFGFALAMGVMLYLTFFLLRDGRSVTRSIGAAVPLHREDKRALFEKFITVIRATVKGSIVVAVVQGLLGGMIFAFLDIPAALLWGVVMGVLSLVPAVGTGLVWAPVAIYLFATGDATDGIILTVFGVFVIGMIDNILRPILVGADTRMPDYVVLISTLGGISVFGINGFIIGPMIAAMFFATWEIFGNTRAAKHAGLDRD